MLYEHVIVTQVEHKVYVAADSPQEAARIADAISTEDVLMHGVLQPEPYRIRIGKPLEVNQHASVVFDFMHQPQHAFTYGFLNRPPGYGTCPSDSIIPGSWRESPDFTYGLVDFSRPLTVRELYRYEMVPVDPLPCLPLYMPGTKVRRMNTGKVFEVEAYEDGYVIGDHVMINLRDWLMYEPAVTP